MVQVSDDKKALFEAAVKERQPYYQKRIELFEKYHQREEAAIEAAKAANVPMKVTLPDGATKDGIKGVTTPLDIANSISKSLAKKVVVAKVDGEVWDLFRPLEGDCNISLHTFDDADGKEVRQQGDGGDAVIHTAGSDCACYSRVHCFTGAAVLACCGSNGCGCSSGCSAVILEGQQ